MDIGFVLLMIFFAFILGFAMGLYAPVVAVWIFKTIKFNLDLDLEDDDNEDGKKERKD